MPNLINETVIFFYYIMQIVGKYWFSQFLRSLQVGDGSDAPESSDLKEIVVSTVSKKHKSKGE